MNAVAVVRPSGPGDGSLAGTAAELIADLALSEDLAVREESWLLGKLEGGQAVVALVDGDLVGLGTWSDWEDGAFVSHSALAVRPDHRRKGLARRIKELLLESSRAHFPRAALMSLTSSPAVHALNTALGFRPAPLADLTRDPAFWAGCQTCRNFADVQARGELCCCGGMLLLPEDSQ